MGFVLAYVILYNAFRMAYALEFRQESLRRVLNV